MTMDPTSDSAKLALDWAQVITAIRERDDWKATSDSWRMVANAWQDWAAGLLTGLGRQPLHGQHGDEQARAAIAYLAGLAAKRAAERKSRLGKEPR